MKKELLYVIQFNSKDGSKELLGFNLTEIEKNKLFHSLGKDGNSAIGNDISDDAHLSNGYGCHKKKFKDANDAFDNLVVMPDNFNEAMRMLNDAGYDVVKKGVVNKKQVVVSYQMEKTDIF